MIKIAICDDEIQVVEKLKSCITEYKKVVFDIDSFTSGEELLMSKLKYDIIILDIDMKGINGIDTAKRIRETDKKVKIIYLTNYTDYTIFAFNVHAFAYLLKPINLDELYKQLDEALIYKYETEGKEIEFVTTDGLIRINYKDILYFEYQNRYIKLVTQQTTYVLKTRINDIYNDMVQYNFEMPHKSFVVNLYHVSDIKGYDIIMTNGTILPLSQKKSREFRSKLNNFLSNELQNKRGVF